MELLVALAFVARASAREWPRNRLPWRGNAYAVSSPAAPTDRRGLQPATARRPPFGREGRRRRVAREVRAKSVLRRVCLRCFDPAVVLMLWTCGAARGAANRGA